MPAAVPMMTKNGRFSYEAAGNHATQPLVFLHSFSELTELPFAFLLTLGFWAYQRRQFLLMAFVMGFG